MPRPRPVAHPFALTSEQVSLLHRNEVAARRIAAINEIRTSGPVRMPSYWPLGSGERILPQTNAFIATRFVRVGPLELPPMPLGDLLDARRALGAVPNAAVPAGAVDVRERATLHERARRRARSAGTIEPHAPLPELEPTTGTPIAIVTATTSSGRAAWRSQHVLRLGRVLEADLPGDEAARAAAQRLLALGDARQHLALVRAGDGSTSVVGLEVPDLLSGEPLVGSIAGSGASLSWRPTTTSLVAVAGLDGVVWL